MFALLTQVKASVKEYAANYSTAATDGKILSAIADDIDRASQSVG